MTSSSLLTSSQPFKSMRTDAMDCRLPFLSIYTFDSITFQSSRKKKEKKIKSITFPNLILSNSISRAESIASVPNLLFLALWLSVVSLTFYDPLISFSKQNSDNSLVNVTVYTFLFVLLPFTFFSAILLLLSHVAIPVPRHGFPLLHVPPTKNILIELKSIASIQNLLFLALSLSISGLLLSDFLLTFANQNPNNSFISIAIHSFLFFLLPFTFFSAIILLLFHVAMSPL